MDDRLQRRLQAADPLTAGTGEMPDPVTLDATKEQILMTDHKHDPAMPSRRARALPIGLGTVAAVALAAVVVGNLAQPAGTLAFEPTPTPVDDATKAAAADACAQDLTLGEIEGMGSVEAGEEPMTGTLPDGGVIVPLPPGGPADLPPLVSLELHGTGGVALFADDETVVSCMLLRDGDTWVRGPVFVSPNPATAPGLASTGVSTTVFEGQTITIIFGTAPAGTATMEIDGGTGDGAIGNVTNGGYGIWVPGDASSENVVAVARDAAGTEIERYEIEPGELRVVVSTR